MKRISKTLFRRTCSKTTKIYIYCVVFDFIFIFCFAYLLEIHSKHLFENCFGKTMLNEKRVRGARTRFGRFAVHDVDWSDWTKLDRLDGLQ